MSSFHQYRSMGDELMFVCCCSEYKIFDGLIFWHSFLLTATMTDENGTENANGDALGRGEYTCNAWQKAASQSVTLYLTLG